MIPVITKKILLGTYYYSGDDEIWLKEGVTPDMLSLDKVGTDLLIHVGETDSLTASQWFETEYRLDYIRFADNTVWKPNSPSC